MARYVAYVRVSTDKQGKSGLGLEAQIAIIRGRLGPDDTLIQPVQVEVESGRMRKRPVLAAALDRCRTMRATLVVAKLDRLARDAAFVSEIVASDVAVLFCDLPETQGAAGAFVLGMMAQAAQLEAGLISERTKAALQARRARGLPLGHAAVLAKRARLGLAPDHTPTWQSDPRIPRAASAVGRAARVAAQQGRAAQAARAIAPVLAELRAEGVTSHRATAAALNARGHYGPAGGAWTATAVRRATERLAGLGEPR